MLRHYRRLWIIPVAMMLAAPLLATVVAPNGALVSKQEARQLASLPSWPTSLSGWLLLPRHIDAYLTDHFGLRQPLITAYDRILDQPAFRSGNQLVLLGLHGWMFSRANAMVPQSAGLLRRDADVARLVKLLQAMRDRLATQDARLLVALPPNSTSIYVQELPLWAQNPGRRTEYDVLLDDLAAQGIKGVDLRPALRTATTQGKAYRMHDTHWTMRGALAAFNAIVDADGHADWQLDPASVLGPPAMVQGGDLARMLGVDDRVSESDRPLALPEGAREQLSDGPFGTFVATSGKPGPTIMIIGDSFTQHFFPPMLLQHVGQVVWLHHQFCGFDWSWIERFHPDEVWWMPTERYILCTADHGPIGFADPAQRSSDKR